MELLLSPRRATRSPSPALVAVFSSAALLAATTFFFLKNFPAGALLSFAPATHQQPPSFRTFPRASFSGGGDDEDGDACNVFDGMWLRDDESSWPLYAEEECPYIHRSIACQSNGRPEKEYQHWRWKPHSCSLPRFKATFMLEMLRGKRMVFAGDSMNHGQFKSMIRLLQSVIPEGSKSYERLPDSRIELFRAMEYNASVEFDWAPLLLESNCENKDVPDTSQRAVRAGSMESHGAIFN